MTNQPNAMAMEAVARIDLGQPAGQLRAAPMRVAGRRCLLLAWCADFDVDPYLEMFFFPTDTLKLGVFTVEGEELWRRDLGPGVVPGVWFCPVLPFDLDGDGSDEVWFVDNINTAHPLGASGYRLTRLDAADGEPTGRWEWPYDYDQRMSHTFRHFLAAGRAGDEPILVAAQGTYGRRRFQAYGPGMTGRWEKEIPPDAPGAMGSHMCPIADFDGDGVQELMWGERCLRLSDGGELFCADRDGYRGHSDVILPTWDRENRRWLLYTCRESDTASPRVAMYDARGERVWGDVGSGHMDMGWVARIKGDGGHLAMAIRIGHKTCGPDGRHHQQMDEFVWDAATGERVELPFSVYRTLPVDLTGDGRHELVRGVPGGDGAVLDGRGRQIGSVGGTAALVCKFCDRPGEQVLAYDDSGTVAVWANRSAEDAAEARARYAHPLYVANARLAAVGYNVAALAGL